MIKWPFYLNQTFITVKENEIIILNRGVKVSISPFLENRLVVLTNWPSLVLLVQPVTLQYIYIY